MFKIYVTPQAIPLNPPSEVSEKRHCYDTVCFVNLVTAEFFACTGIVGVAYVATEERCVVEISTASTLVSTFTSLQSILEI